MAGNTVSVTIDDAGVRVMVTRGKRIIKLAAMPLDRGISDNINSDEEKAISEKIKTLLESNRISDRKVIVGVSALHCLTRPAVLPVLPKAMIQEAILREARRVLPIPPEQLYLSWQIIAGDQENQTAFLAGIPKAQADTVMRIFQGAGLKPYLMDFKPLALARLAPVPDCIIVDVQPKEFDLVIMAGGIPHPVRTVPFADTKMTLREKADTIGGEIERTVQFYNSSNPDNQLPENTCIFFSGDITDEPELYEGLAARAGFQTALLESPLKCAKHLDASQYMTNAGLILKKYPRDNVPLLTDLNTLPGQFLPKQVSLKKVVMIPAAVAVAAALIVMVINVQNAGARLQATENSISMTNTLLNKRVNDANEMRATINSLQEQITEMDSLLSGAETVLHDVETYGEYVNGDLEPTLDSLSTGIQVLGIEHIMDRIAVSGEANSEQEVIRYAREMTETGRFSEITIERIELITGTEGDYVDFQLLVNTEGR